MSAKRSPEVQEALDKLRSPEDLAALDELVEMGRQAKRRVENPTLREVRDDLFHDIGKVYSAVLLLIILQFATIGLVVWLVVTR
ncbi:hypothetical protein P6F26_12975 [Roseibacterium sp. SDUM158017]|uniref:hypothetical protein n=1 Tax=Roseicyclus salinarum TaxID=3036773 RepID=UPI002414EA45|nr:hypothetical protein [Roseibacterium sp. SDUM158017]MDG4649357.1 hypothetical protein [Roseibacterium sp. SDUM158017]